MFNCRIGTRLACALGVLMATTLLVVLLGISEISSLLAERRQVDTRELLLGVAALGFILVGLSVSWWTIRSIVSPLKHATDVARRLAEGDLTVTFNSELKDEVGDLIRAMGEMTKGLKPFVFDVRNSANLIASTSQQIATDNVELSRRTERHAIALEETAATMEELTSTVKGNAANAQNANHLAKEASDTAAHGGVAMQQVLDTMHRISASSSKIVDIISVIDAIAFQTNILALNAAVEAARAGEHGRGFAVVATEVRNLAHRSAVSAKEIKVLISESVDEINRGAKFAEDASHTMKDVVASVNRMALMMSEVTLSSQEQASGIEQLNIAIADIDHGTQQNAAMVQQGASATELLLQQTQALRQSVVALHIGPVDSQSSSSATAHELSKSIVQTNSATSHELSKSTVQTKQNLDQKSSFGMTESLVPDLDRDWSKF
jgi:methyl-accepting chemotaxis protein